MEITNIPAISVIIPMYNVEKYIGECLDSILMQTFQDFEVIIVNDCSTDNSLQIAESYLEKFGGRLRIYTNEKNLGPSTSRNNGLMFSRGEYIFFMDSDDMFIPTALKEMYTIAKKFDADFLSFTIRCNMSEDGKKLHLKTHRRPVLTEDVILVDDGKTLYLVDINDLQTVKNKVLSKSTFYWRIRKFVLKNRIPWEVWLKFLRRDFLIENKIFFPKDIYLAEDHVWMHAIFFFAKKIVYVPRALYHHRRSIGSIVRTERTDLQSINLWVNVIINGTKYVDELMNRLKFFKKKPNLRYAVLESFSQRYFRRIFECSLKYEQYDIYESITQGFGKELGEHKVLLPQLIAYVNDLQKRIFELEKQLKINEPETQFNENEK